MSFEADEDEIRQAFERGDIEWILAAYRYKGKESSDYSRLLCSSLEKDEEMTDKKRVTDEFGVIEDGMSLESIRDLCDSAIHSTEWINCRLEVKWADCEYDADRYVIEGERWETDKEWSKRLKEEERTRLAKTKQKADKEAYERQQYERLKKKFEGK